MRRVVSISLGSPARNHTIQITLLGEDFLVERIGTGGNINQMMKMIRTLDGKADVFGLGGISLNLYTLNRVYELRDARRIMKAARITPIVDGSGIKNTLERKIIREIASPEIGLLNKDSKVLLMCALDRFGMARSFLEIGCETAFGDFPFTIGVPLLLKSLKSLNAFAKVLLPVIRLLPFSVIYTTGEKQEVNQPRFGKYFAWADVLAGDTSLIKRFAPPDLSGKIIIANTITTADIEFFRQRNARTLVATTPDMGGRSFGTNVIEALLISLSGETRPLTEEEYHAMLNRVNFTTRIIDLS